MKLAALLFIGFTALVPVGNVWGQNSTPGNGNVIQDLRSFLFDPAARRDFAKGNQDASAVNNYLEAFPKWAQNELLEIVMMIASESMLDSSKHVAAYQQGGVEGAKASFSPAVRARSDQLFQKLMNDPSFNTPENLQRLNKLMPVIRGGKIN